MKSSLLRTTPIQRSAWAFNSDRQEESFTTGTATGYKTATGAQRNATTVGFIALCLIAIIALVVKFLNPSPNLDDKDFIVTKEGAQFVKYNDLWHEVTNTTSARLLLGKADNPTTVKAEALNNAPRGQRIGIIGAPGAFPTHDTETSTFSTCTQFVPTSRTNLEDTARVDTIIIAGNELNATGTPLKTGEATIVQDNTTTNYWLILADGHRSRIQPINTPLLNALGIGDEDLHNATQVSPTFLNTLPATDELTTPTIPNTGNRSDAVPTAKIGSLLTTNLPDEETTTFLVHKDGIQPVGPFVARLLTLAGTETANTPATTIANAPRVETTDLSAYPTTIPTIQTGKSTCTTWTKATPDTPSATTITTADTLPLDSDKKDNIVQLMPGIGPEPTADYSYTTPGKGWLVQTTGNRPDSLLEGQLFWIDDAGVRYPIAGDDNDDPTAALNALGLDEVSPLAAPWSILALYSQGPTLSETSARTLHTGLIDDSQVLPKEK